jgi:hypothetical protein
MLGTQILGLTSAVKCCNLYATGHLSEKTWVLYGVVASVSTLGFFKEHYVSSLTCLLCDPMAFCQM